jgi:hypothetical protein
MTAAEPSGESIERGEAGDTVGEVESGEATEPRAAVDRMAPTATLPQLPRLPLAHRIRRVRPAYRIVNRIERLAAARALPYPIGTAAQRVLERRGGRLRVLEVVPGVTGARATAANRDLVVELCRTHEVPYFVVPEPRARRTRIGIPADAWPAFAGALVAAGRLRPLYAAVDARNARGERRRWPELLTDPRLAAAVAEQAELEVFTIACPAPGASAFDRPWACVVERWERTDDGGLQAPSRNARTSFIAATSQRPATLVRDGRLFDTFAPLTARHLFDIDFPIDVVYMWVDGADPAWQERKARALKAAGVRPDADPAPASTGSAAERFRDNGELRYSLRSVEQFAPWVRHIYLVTDRQVPRWLDPASTRITVVDHTEIFGTAGVLPNFNSHAIGARLHHIEGLSEHYLHFNDDFFLGRDVSPSTFFHSNGRSKFFLSRSTLPLLDTDLAPEHEVARRNVVELLARDFDRRPSQAFFHTPIAQQRSLMTELEQRYPAEFATTWSHQLRDRSDYEINSWLHHYYGFLTGRAVEGSIRYDYFDVADERVWNRMERALRQRSLDTFCINDSAEATPEQRQRGALWLERYFPMPSSFERDSGSSFGQKPATAHSPADPALQTAPGT